MAPAYSNHGHLSPSCPDSGLPLIILLRDLDRYLRPLPKGGINDQHGTDLSSQSFSDISYADVLTILFIFSFSIKTSAVIRDRYEDTLRVLSR